MSLFHVDPEKCRRDGICVEICPLGLIQMAGENALPSPVQGAGQFCINCGHCVSVCPRGALSLKTMQAEECTPVRRELLPAAEQVRHFLRARRSVRVYKNTPVERALLAELIDTARYAPSGHNAQPLSWLIVESPGQVNSLAALVVDWMRHCIREKPEMAGPLHLDRVVASWEGGEDRVCRSAPHIVVAHAPAASVHAPAASTIALTYLELAAFSMGLGACWAGYFNLAANFYPPLARALALPEGHRCFGAMLVGYPKYTYKRIPLRNEAAVTWL